MGRAIIGEGWTCDGPWGRFWVPAVSLRGLEVGLVRYLVIFTKYLILRVLRVTRVPDGVCWKKLVWALADDVRRWESSQNTKKSWKNCGFEVQNRVWVQIRSDT